MAWRRVMAWLRRHWPTLLVHLAAPLPLLLLLVDWANDNLTANPIQAATQRTGLPALILLTLSLACTPLNAATGLKWVMTLRRPLGLYGFAYAVVHMLIFVWVDYGLNPDLLWEAVSEKRYVLAGLSALLLLTPLAITSTRGWMRRLGRRWRTLHRLVYLAVPLAVVHYLWLVKADLRGPLAFGAAVALLLALRLPPVRRGLVSLRDRIRPATTGTRGGVQRPTRAP